MNMDIGDILDSWPYKPGEVNVRKILAKDGQEKLQLRLDLGILQMALTGRPDGARPHGFESLLDYYIDKLAIHKATNSDHSFELNPCDCEQLRNEGVMYYHRYLAGFVVGEYDIVKRDTARNLKMFDLCSKYASTQEDQTAQDMTRPYVHMMHARSCAHIKLAQNDPAGAFDAVKYAIEQIEDLYHRIGKQEFLNCCTELMTLRSLARDIELSIPEDPIHRLEKSLKDALCEERYEEAAHIRDRIQQLKLKKDN